MALLDTIRRAVDKGVKAAKLYRTATLIRVTPGTRTPGAAASGTNPTTVSYPCRGLIAAYDAKAIQAGLVHSDDRMITLIGGSLPAGIVPRKTDAITIQDLDRVSRTFKLVDQPSADEAGGAWICQGRK